MRLTIGVSWVSTCLLLCMCTANATALGPRQPGTTPSLSASPSAASSTSSLQSSGFPPLLSLSTTSSPAGPAALSASLIQSAPSTLLTSNSTLLSSTTTTPSVLTSTASATHTLTPTAGNNATNGTRTIQEDPLPLRPKITPGLSIAGVVLIMSGSAYVLIGIKNKWIHIFLSSAYLTSLSITVLIIYVMSPPISSAIQGAYVVAAFMTGALFGAGSLMFPEITEGLGCILGGVCLSMWFLVLKSGGSLTGTVSKIVFVLVFGVAVWCLSFIRRIRPYALIGAASFSGATAVVLGIDCFSRAGLKEFWLYIWALNDNVFPLNTDTYPVTRGMQVEIAAIVLLCVVGVISQLSLWKVIKERREKKETEQRDLERRQSVMEEAMGRFLEARTDRERAQWERVYGPQWDNIYNDRVRGSRNTLGDGSTVFGNDNRKSWISIRELPAGSAAPAGVELNHLSLARPEHSATSRSKRQSAMTVNTIPEDDETETAITDSHDRPSASNADGRAGQGLTSPQYLGLTAPSLPPLAFMTLQSTSVPTSASEPFLAEKAQKETDPQHAEKRKSGSSILERLSGHSGTAVPRSRSEEALIAPERSRASSIAATLNDEPGDLDLRSVHSETDQVVETRSNQLVAGTTGSSRKSHLGEQPPSPATLSVEFDPEELARPLHASPADSLKPAVGPNMTGPHRSDICRTSDSNARQSIATRPTEMKGTTPLALDSLSTESLTEGALVQVPSQLSNLVLTYRTNEWAKHISNAEEPLDDDTHAVLGEALAESPVQLVEAPAPVRVEDLAQRAIDAQAQPCASTLHKSTQALVRPDKRDSAVRLPPELPIAPSRATPHNQKEAPAPHRSLSDQSIAATPTIIVRPPTAASGPYASARPPRLSRTRSSPQVNQTLRTTVDENAESKFPSSSASLSPPPTSPTQSASPPLKAQPEKASVTPYLPRSASYQTLPTSKLSSQMYQQALATTSDTRLSSSYDTRQPARRASNFVPGKRESMLAEWQGSLRRESSMMAAPKVTLEQRRAEMMLERRQSQQSKQREEENQQNQEKAAERAMRTTDMLALHRETLRKMQAKANKHV